MQEQGHDGGHNETAVKRSEVLLAVLNIEAFGWPTEMISRFVIQELLDMKTSPADLKVQSIVDALVDRWNMCHTSLRYAPLGFGSHHWIAEEPDGQKWFVTVDDLRADHFRASGDQSLEILTTAVQTAAALRDVANLSFVIGPIADGSGKVVYRLDHHYAMSVFPFLDVEPTGFGTFQDTRDRNGALSLIGRLHNATRRISVDGLRQDTLTVPSRADLEMALQNLDGAWSGGPYSEPARLLLREHAQALQKSLRHFDDVSSSVKRDTTGWVITHGEPHAANVIRPRSGELVVVDWDTVAYAPRERDLWMLVDESQPDWSPYRDETGVASLSGIAMNAYRLHWSLSEIAIYVSWCLKPHERTQEMSIAWAGLQEYLEQVA